MSKGDTKRPRAAHITKEQYDANYDAIFRSGAGPGPGPGATQRSDRSDNRPDSGVPEEPDGQPDPQTQEVVEGEGCCPECGFPFPASFPRGTTVSKVACSTCTRPSFTLTDIDYGDKE